MLELENVVFPLHITPAISSFTAFPTFINLSTNLVHKKARITICSPGFYCLTSAMTSRHRWKSQSVLYHASHVLIPIAPFHWLFHNAFLMLLTYRVSPRWRLQARPLSEYNNGRTATNIHDESRQWKKPQNRLFVILLKRNKKQLVICEKQNTWKHKTCEN